MIVVEPPGDRDLILVGPVRGLLDEARRARDRIAEFRPQAIGLGLSPSEVESLTTHFVGTASEPVVPLAPGEVREALSLVRFGEVGVPNPTATALLEFGRETGIPVEGLDPDEEVQAELFIANIGYWELVRRTLGERRIGRRPPETNDPDAFALAWDAALHPGRGSARYAQARDRVAAEALRTLRHDHRRVAVVLDRERVEGFARLLGPSGTGPAYEPE